MPEPQYIVAAAGANWDPSVLEPLAELNFEVLDALLGVGSTLGWRWRALGDEARVRLARCPFLLVDLGGAQPQRWSSLTRVGVHEAQPVSALLAQRGPLPTPLLRRVLLFAWHLARANRLAARITLGMGAPCAALVAACRFADLEALAESRPAWILPRWHDRTEIWQGWLAAAAEESPRGLENLQLWGMQMLAADVIGQRG